MKIIEDMMITNIMTIIKIIIKNIVEVIVKIETQIIQTMIKNIEIEIKNIKEDQDRVQGKVAHQ